MKRSKPLRSRPVGVISLRLREEVRERASLRCQRCGVSDYTRRCDAHHRKLKSQGGQDTLENLAYLCRQCHDHVHLNREESVRDGWIISESAKWGSTSGQGGE